MKVFRPGDIVGAADLTWTGKYWGLTQTRNMVPAIYVECVYGDIHLVLHSTACRTIEMSAEFLEPVQSE